jgi:hypothetical protein
MQRKRVKALNHLVEPWCSWTWCNQASVVIKIEIRQLPMRWISNLVKQYVNMMSLKFNYLMEKKVLIYLSISLFRPSQMMRSNWQSHKIPLLEFILTARMPRTKLNLSFTKALPVQPMIYLLGVKEQPLNQPCSKNWRLKNPVTNFNLSTPTKTWMTSAPCLSPE